MDLSRRRVLETSAMTTGALAFSAAAGASAGAQQPNKQPHILLINCDDLGRHLGCYGNDTVATPRIDQLAAEGVRLTDAFSAAPSCSPSRGALTTGLSPHANGIAGLQLANQRWSLAPGVVGTPYLLRERGYDTWMFGKQHIVTTTPDLTNRVGFDHAPVRVAPASGIVDDVEKALDSITDKHRPLYLEVNFVEPHLPFLRGVYQPDSSRGVDVPSYLPEDEVTRSETANLQGALRGLDAAVGRLLDSLARRGLDKDTIVLFTGDNGLPFPTAKCTLYDRGVEVPMIVRWPKGRISGGRSPSGLVSQVDVQSTLLELIGAPPRAGTEGVSFAPLLLGTGPSARSEIFVEKTHHESYDPMRGIRTKNHKLIRNFEFGYVVEVPNDIRESPTWLAHPELATGAHPPVELYDLVKDPLERTNLAGRAEVRGIQTDLNARLWRWMQDTGDPLVNGPVRTPFYAAARASKPV